MSALKTAALSPEKTSSKKTVPTLAYVLLVIAMTTGGFIAPLIRLTLDAGMPPVVLVGVRLLLAWLVFTPFALSRYRHELRGLKRRQIVLAVIAGILLSLHFTSMSVALLHVSVMVGQVLVNTSPLWVASLETVFLKVKLPRIVLAGLVMAVLGGVLIGFGSAERTEEDPAESVPIVESMDEAPTEKNPVFGVTILFVSAVGVSIYLTIGRSIRGKVALVPYVWIAYGSGAMTSLVLTIGSGTALLGYSAEAYLWVFLLMIVGQLLVHTSWNYAMGYLPATVTSISGQMISVMAAIVAVVLFAEVPNKLELLGGAVIVTGVMIAILSQREGIKRPSKT